jgi:hypothetical protein
MKAQDIVKAITKLRPTAQYTFIEDDYSSIEWFVLEGDAPTAKEITDAIATIKKDEAAAAKADAATKAALLERLGITEAEAKLLLA